MDDGVRVVSNWSTLVESFNTSTLEFYQLVERNVEMRQVPDIKFSRKNLSESHIFSSSREYLLARRKQFTFAICSAPYGTGQFFSWWLVEEQSFFERMMRAIPILNRLYESATAHETFYRGFLPALT